MKVSRGTIAASLLGLLLVSQASAAPRITFQEELIEGEVQKPEVAVFISRQNLTKKYTFELRESLLPKIIRSVEEPPF